MVLGLLMEFITLLGIDMDYLFLTIGLTTAILFMFKIEWLLDLKPFLINLGYDLILFLISCLMSNRNAPKTLSALKMPLISSLIFFILCLAFRHIYLRNPENTFWVFRNKPVQDVIFTLLFWFLGIGLPFLII